MSAMDTVYIWIGWALLAIGTLGCLVPVLPGPPIAFASLFLALAAGDHTSPSMQTLVIAGAVTMAVIVLDYIVPAIGARKFNCSKAGVVGCFIGTMIGLFFLPFGMIVGAFLGALLGEAVIAGKNLGPALRGAFGALLGHLAGILLKLSCCGFLAYCFYKSV